MPVSDMYNVGPIMTEVDRLQPNSILDIGVGFGKYGVLCREVLEAKHGLVKADDRKVTMIGIEAFANYSNPVWGVYDQVITRDFMDDYEYTDFDLVLMIDSLEHVEETAGQAVLRYLVEHNKNVIVSVPLGSCPQDGVFGNPYEKHRATFYGESEFSNYKYRVLHRGTCLVLSINGVK